MYEHNGSWTDMIKLIGISHVCAECNCNKCLINSECLKQFAIIKNVPYYELHSYIYKKSSKNKI